MSTWNSGFNENLWYCTDKSYNTRISVSMMTFPGGEVGVNINSGSDSHLNQGDQDVEFVSLIAKIQNSEQLMAMFLATDAIRRVYPLAKIGLNIPYFPYARQDRVCNAGEALSVKVVATLINAQDYASVVVVDPHSPVLVAALDRCHVVNQFDCFSSIKQDWGNWVIVAPDQGALKKVEDFAKRVGAKGVISFNKKRELSTGKIIGMTCLDDFDPDDQFLVLDDICDGGRTFIELVGHMSFVDTLELAVTHGIFSKGVAVLTDHFDRVYTTNSLPQTEHPKLTVVKI